MAILIFLDVHYLHKMENHIITLSVAVIIFLFTYKIVLTGKAIAQVSSQSNTNEKDIFYQGINWKEFGIPERLMVENDIRFLTQKETAFVPTIKDITAPVINMLNEITELGEGIFPQNNSLLFSWAVEKTDNNIYT